MIIETPQFFELGQFSSRRFSVAWVTCLDSRGRRKQWLHRQENELAKGMNNDEALIKAGYQPVYRATSSEEDLDHALDGVHGLVVVGGGDGTVRAVASRLIGKNIPLAVIPSGTANNIARALGIEGNSLEIIAGLEQPMRRYYDVGKVQAPWGEDYFLEAAGYG